MSVCQQAIRKRRQMANGYRHLAPKRRPHYVVRAKDVAARRLARLVEREKMMKSRKK